MIDIEERLAATGADISALREKLIADAAADGVLDIAYRELDSPIGALLVAQTQVGLVRVAFGAEGFDRVLTELSTQVSPRVLHAPGRLDSIARELEEFLSGSRQTFDVPLDWRLISGFRRAVVEYLPSIGYGTTASYADVAQAVGNPKAVRAVGSACGHNPLPLVVPCHRVVRSDGSSGQYRGGPEIKRTLLDLEHAA